MTEPSSSSGSHSAAEESSSDSNKTATTKHGINRKHSLSLRDQLGDLSVSNRRSAVSSNLVRSHTGSSIATGSAGSPSHAPNLPSPLSTCQQAADSDDEADPRTAVEPDEYPFPTTPVWPTFDNPRTPMPRQYESVSPPFSSSTNRATSLSSAPTSPMSVPPASKRAAAAPGRSQSIHSEVPLMSEERIQAAMAARQAHQRAASTVGHSHPSPLTPPEAVVRQDQPNWRANEVKWRRELDLGTTAYMMFNPDSSSRHSSADETSPMLPSSSQMQDRPKGDTAPDAAGATVRSGSSHFGIAARDKLSEMLTDLLDTLPRDLRDQIFNIVEYGAMHSRSAQAIPSFLSHLSERRNEDVAFQVYHVDTPHTDFRPLALELESSSESYLNAKWAASQKPSLEDRVFSATIARPLSSKVLPKNSVSVGFSVMALHWPFTERKFRLASPSLAHAELMAFLAARAGEFKSNGLLGLAYISRSEERSAVPGSLKVAKPPVPSRSQTEETISGRSTPESPAFLASRERSASSPDSVPLATRDDIWSVLTGVLSKAIQRLVSTGLLKPAVARQLLALPIHPRTPRQTKAVLTAMSHSWTIEVDQVITLSHPAWRGLEHRTVSPSSYTEQTVSLLKAFWEAEARTILRETSGSKAAAEYVLECLFDVAREKVEEQGPKPLDLDVQILVLRRRERDEPAGEEEEDDQPTP